MKSNKRIAVVIPSYKVVKHIKDVINTLPQFIDYIIVVDDKCPMQSGRVAEELNNSKVIVLFHEKNKGVGGAVVTGYKKAVELNADIVIKMDGDGQMNPDYIEELIEPIINNRADYTKGNRFNDFNALRSMPNVRLFGNSVLSFLVKVSSGYWNMMDPTNGYTAISKEAINGVNLNSLSKRYFFESDMLINLNIENLVVKDVAIPARYGDEESSLKISKVMFEFPFKLFKGFCKRISFKYFIYNFNMASIYIILGLPMIFFGSIFGAYRWFLGAFENIENSCGTVMLSVLPIILGTQFLLQAISIDIDSIPKKRDK